MGSSVQLVLEYARSSKDELDEKWFIRQCQENLKLYHHVSKFKSQLLCKIMRMLVTTLTSFKDAKLIDRQFWRFSVRTAELAWDFQRGPIPEQVHGFNA